jgi:hypothetical protein
MILCVVGWIVGILSCRLEETLLAGLFFYPPLAASTAVCRPVTLSSKTCLCFLFIYGTQPRYG